MKTKVLVVVRWPVGGIRTYLRYVYNVFCAERYCFTLVAPDLPETRILLEDLRGHEVDYIPLQECGPVALARQLLEHLSQGRYDLIHSHGITAGVASVVPSRLFRIPHIMTVHDVFTPKQLKGVKGTLKRAFFMVALPFIHKIHTVSRDANANLISYIPTLLLARSRVVTIRNGIETERFMEPATRELRAELALGADTFVIGFFGRFMSQKGFVYLVDALEILYRTHKLSTRPIVLAFGEGAFEREERLRVENKRLTEVIRFMPFTPNVAGVLKDVDLVVMPSLWEACPLLAMEAMVAGTPVIGTDCCGLREVLKDTPCQVVPPADSVALAGAIAREIKSPSKGACGAFSQEAARRFDVRSHGVALSRVMDDLVQARATRGPSPSCDQ